MQEGFEMRAHLRLCPWRRGLATREARAEWRGTLVMVSDKHTFPTKNRCDVCGSSFTTEALLADHQRLHEAETSEEKEEILKEQAERKP